MYYFLDYVASLSVSRSVLWPICLTTHAFSRCPCFSTLSVYLHSLILHVTSFWPVLGLGQNYGLFFDREICSRMPAHLGTNINNYRNSSSCQLSCNWCRVCVVELIDGVAVCSSMIHRWCYKIQLLGSVRPHLMYTRHTPTHIGYHLPNKSHRVCANIIFCHLSCFCGRRRWVWDKHERLRENS
jgi:hypothetical protein